MKKSSGKSPSVMIRRSFLSLSTASIWSRAQSIASAIGVAPQEESGAKRRIKSSAVTAASAVNGRMSVLLGPGKAAAVTVMPFTFFADR